MRNRFVDRLTKRLECLISCVLELISRIHFSTYVASDQCYGLKVLAR
ncbi:hypothetical protein S7335_5239 [Synechococcus sp. PCC 7335]|nr:hypothetical protein S7335_5239 [Synechococcus sp. PCC 7335]